MGASLVRIFVSHNMAKLSKKCLCVCVSLIPQVCRLKIQAAKNETAAVKWGSQEFPREGHCSDPQMSFSLIGGLDTRGPPQKKKSKSGQTLPVTAQNSGTLRRNPWKTLLLQKRSTAPTTHRTGSFFKSSYVVPQFCS